jgi:hypothetical protein
MIPHVSGRGGGFEFHGQTVHKNGRKVHQTLVRSEPDVVRRRAVHGLRRRFSFQGLGAHHDQRDSDRRPLRFQRGKHISGYTLKMYGGGIKLFT